MRYSYGIVDRKQVLAYRPQLFQRTDDILVFPSKEFAKWHSEIIELLDGIYQINAKKFEKGSFMDDSDLNLTMGLIVNINEEMEGLFDPNKEVDLSYHYFSTMDEKFKARKNNFYGRYFHKVDRNVVEITPYMKYKHMMEIVDYAHKLWRDESRFTKLKIKK
jgi:hypothetical protein